MPLLLRIRLIVTCSFEEEKFRCWFLYDRDTCSTVSDLMKLVEQRFGLTNFNCWLKGSFLPGDERIEIIRDEDEITIESTDPSVSYKVCVLDKQHNKTSRSKDPDKGCQTKIGTVTVEKPQLSSTNNKDLMCRKVPSKKRKRSSNEPNHPMKLKDLKANKEHDRSSHELGKDILNSVSKIAEGSSVETEALTAINKNHCKIHKVKRNKKRLRESGCFENENPVDNGKIDIADNMNNNDNENIANIAMEKKKKKKKRKKSEINSSLDTKTNAISVPEITAKSCESSKAANSEKAILDTKNNDADLNNKATHVHEVGKEAREESIQINIKSSKWSHARKSSNNKSHIYFGSDEEDWDNSQQQKADCAKVNGTEHLRTIIKDKVEHQALSNLRKVSSSPSYHPKICHKENIIPIINNLAEENIAKQIATDNELKSTALAIASVIQNGTKDFSACKPLFGVPRAGDKIAYKTLELSLSYTPEISDFKEAEVLAFDNASNIVNLLLSDTSMQKKLGDGDSFSRKFELPTDDEDVTEEPENLVEINWKDVINPLLLKN